MNRLHVFRLGFATATTFTLLYAGCLLTVCFVDRESAIYFFNSMFHYLDFTAIIRVAPISAREALIGVAEFFIGGWLIGASVAAIYNVSSLNNKP